MKGESILSEDTPQITKPFCAARIRAASDPCPFLTWNSKDVLDAMCGVRGLDSFYNLSGELNICLCHLLEWIAWKGRCVTTDSCFDGAVTFMGIYY
jgi:hypothetical protein